MPGDGTSLLPGLSHLAQQFRHQLPEPRRLVHESTSADRLPGLSSRGVFVANATFKPAAARLPIQYASFFA